jgi:hypothetical protein
MRAASQQADVRLRAGWRILWFGMTVMAGEAGHFAGNKLITLVDVLGHEDHFASHLFGRFVILLETGVIRVDDMAEVALDAERRIDLSHDRDELVGGQVFEYLDILVLRACLPVQNTGRTTAAPKQSC